MSHAVFLKTALPAAALPALLVLFLPPGVSRTYADVLEPLSLFVGSLLSLRVSFMYRKQLKAAFVFLSAFLFIYMLAIILFLSYSPILLPYLKRYMTDSEILSLVQGVQFTTYAMLFLFCTNLLKVIDMKQLDRNGWIVFALTVVVCLFVAIYPVLHLIENASKIGLPAVPYIAIRIFDAGLVIVLVPALWLYVQYLKSRHRQSLTFTVIIFGIVCSTISDYLFELASTLFPQLLAPGSHLQSAVPKTLFIYGFLAIAVGLYAHRKQDEWGYNTVDKTISGELELRGK